MFKSFVFLAILGLTFALSLPELSNIQHQKLIKDFQVREQKSFDQFSKVNVNKRDGDGDRGRDDPIRQVPGVSPFPLWNVATFQLGKSRFVQGQAGHPNTPLPYFPNILAVDPVNKRITIKDPVAGQLTTANYSLIWFPTGADANGVPIFTCFADTSAGFVDQQAKHNTAFYLDADVSLKINVSNGHSSSYRKVNVDVYSYAAVTRDFGGGFDSWMPFGGYHDVYTLKPYYFWFSQGQGGPRNPPGSCPSCTPREQVVSGEYIYHGPGSAIADISAAPVNVWVAHPSCYPGGDTTLPINPNILVPYQIAVCFQ